jgi:hypothetical protein
MILRMILSGFRDNFDPILRGFWDDFWNTFGDNFEDGFGMILVTILG